MTTLPTTPNASALAPETLAAPLDGAGRREALRRAVRREMLRCGSATALPQGKSNVSELTVSELFALCATLGIDVAKEVSAYARDLARRQAAMAGENFAHGVSADATPDATPDASPYVATTSENVYIAPPSRETIDACDEALSEAKNIMTQTNAILAPLAPIKGMLDANLWRALEENVVSREKQALGAQDAFKREAARLRQELALAREESASAPQVALERTPLAEGETVGVVKREKANKLFGLRSQGLLAGLELDLWNDPSAPPVDAGYVFEPGVLFDALVSVASGEKTWMFGPAGTGKTTLATQIAARLGRAFFRIAFSRHTEPVELFGSPGLAAGNTVWRDGALTAAIRTPGAIILLDEPTMARPGTLASVQTLLDENYVVLETGERVNVAPGVRFMAADNTNGTGDTSGAYADTQIMNGAFNDRFAVRVAVDYLPKDKEVSALVARSGVRREIAEALVAFAAKSRAKAGGELTQGVGFRRLVALATRLRYGTPAKRAVDLTLLNSASPEDLPALVGLVKADLDFGVLDALARGEAPPAETAPVDYKDARNARAANEFDNAPNA